ncbi:SDR family oxidoreductase, partial [Fastidiosibacter lacustris]|uniref:SDR family oxidoreductase n=1 Tax=Fastidiosibacter lacustris TaxID=2056695 RepID=UPI000E352E4C
IEKVGIDDDFFTLGGNSIKAIQLAVTLQANFDIAVSEIFDLRTPRKLAENRSITHDLLIYKLQQIKHQYHTYSYKSLNQVSLAKKERYLTEVAKMPKVSYTIKPIQNILLTGATGFLGCNLLNQLLSLTSYRIYLCIRAKDKAHAIERMEHKFKFYFDCSLQDNFKDRVVYIPCDLEQEKIGLLDREYQSLAQQIDSIIHCAALAKHYGIEQVFYSANVQATIHLLQFCQLTKHKD